MKKGGLAVAAAMMLMASAAHAGLTGSTVSEEYRFPDVASPYAAATYLPQTFVVGGGQESVINVEGVTDIGVDFADAGLDLVFSTVLANPTWNAAPFNGAVFTGTALAAITGVTVLPSSTFAGFDASRVTVVGDELRLNWNGLSYVDGTRLDLAFTSGAVPEPATWALMIAGFGLVGAVRRRRSASLAA